MKGVNKIICMTSFLRYSLVLAMMLIISTAFAESKSNILKTYQDKCYDDNGTTLASCTGTGQDGEFQTGITLSMGNTISSRLLNNEDGTITDKATGLMWLADAKCTHANLDNTYDNVTSAITAINAGTQTCSGNTANYKDFRLPTSVELESLYLMTDAGTKSELSTIGFSFYDSCLWTTTKDANNTSVDGAYLLGAFYYPYLGAWNATTNTNKNGSCDAVLVRKSGTAVEVILKDPDDSSRFTANSDAITAHDSITGLDWYLSVTKSATFANALAYANSVGGRLPNKRELTMMVSNTQKAPALPVGHPFSVSASAVIWSSTTASELKTNAYVVNLGSTATVKVARRAKSTTAYVWLVKKEVVQDNVSISVSVTGNGNVKDGSGNTITSGDGGTGTKSVTKNTSVTLTATPDTGYKFTAWGGGTCSGTDNCVITPTTDTTVTATFSKDTVNVNFIISGNGSVTDASGGVIATGDGGTGTQTVTRNSSVTLKSLTPTGYTFGGWSGGCAGTGDCTLTPSADTNITATFTKDVPPAVSYSANVIISGDGYVTNGADNSTVASGDGGTGSVSTVSGSSIILKATANANNTFLGWGGLCSGTGDCTITLTSNVSITATFAITNVTVNVSASDGGSITDASGNTIASSGGTGSKSVISGTSTTFKAVANTNYTFLGWSGACSGTGDCTITPTTNTSISATFTQTSVSVTAKVTGNGKIINAVDNTTLASGDGSSYTVTVSKGSILKWKGVPDSGNSMSSWDGACAGVSTAECSFTANGNTSATAAFRTSQSTTTNTLTLGLTKVNMDYTCTGSKNSTCGQTEIQGTIKGSEYGGSNFNAVVSIYLDAAGTGTFTAIGTTTLAMVKDGNSGWRMSTQSSTSMSLNTFTLHSSDNKLQLNGTIYNIGNYTSNLGSSPKVKLSISVNGSYGSTEVTATTKNSKIQYN
ncbi:MAG: DUF1566 domain-containing protein [Nitrospirae bacterium]|nr:DUF1566 domain-containing protein [Nitrospirota bacterium]